MEGQCEPSAQSGLISWPANVNLSRQACWYAEQSINVNTLKQILKKNNQALISSGISCLFDNKRTGSVSRRALFTIKLCTVFSKPTAPD